MVIALRGTLSKEPKSPAASRIVTLSREINLVGELIDGYLDGFPKLREWMEDSVVQVKDVENESVVTGNYPWGIEMDVTPYY